MAAPAPAYPAPIEATILALLVVAQMILTLASPGRPPDSGIGPPALLAFQRRA